MPATTLKQQMNALLEELYRSPAPAALNCSRFPELLPLSELTRRSLYYFLLDVGTPPAKIEEACNMLVGLHAALRRAREYEQLGNHDHQARAYQQTALEVERALSALLHRTLCACTRPRKD